MQKNDRAAIGRTGLGVSDIQVAGIDLLERSEGRVGPWLYGRQRYVAGLRIGRADQAKLGRRNGHSRGAEETTPMKVEFFGRIELIHGTYSMSGARPVQRFWYGWKM